MLHRHASAILDRLNPAQRRAVTTVDGPLLVLAGPGSGKTRVITHRIAYLLAESGSDPPGILAVTFTNKAAREMLERVRVLVPQGDGDLTIGTFHAVCARILRRDGSPIGIPPSFTIADEDDQVAMVRRVLRELNWDEKRFPPRAMLSYISAAKSLLIEPAEFAVRANSYVEERAAVVYRRYQELLVQHDLLDFDDLIMRTVALFREHPAVLARYRERFQHILVDEFQDTNVAQYTFARLLAAEHRNICVVGDEDQSIYSWRHADIGNILNFERDFPGTHVVVLEQNYRSTRTILQAARRLIAPNTMRKEKSLFTENDVGERIVVFEAYDENEEAGYVATQIERLLAAGVARPGEIAVMYRTNAQSRVLEKEFLRHRLPHRVVGMRFYERKEIRDLLAYLRLCRNPHDVASFERIINVPPRQIGAKTLADLRQWARELGVTAPEALELLAEDDDRAAGCPIGARARTALVEFGRLLGILRRASAEMVVARLLERILELTGYRELLDDGTEEGESRLDNVRELITVAEEFSVYGPEGSLAAFLEDAALAADADEYDRASDAVTLITLHAAKGLEFDVVFIVGLEEGLCPHSRSVEDPRQLEEERRLLYVGVTRARRRLFLTYASRRSHFGEGSIREPSRFFRDLPPELVQGTARVIQRPGRSPGLARQQSTAHSLIDASSRESDGQQAPAITLLRPGDRVVHPTFGQGVVVSVVDRDGDQEVTVAFPNLPLKRLLASYAKLRLISS
ncbi:MAG TPA: UvrD-helicase domain-containing protein [Chloroflexota bacterium]|nr:UvrD-helicase domain-containing protein [Chloroflexota bacterium]